MKVLVAASTFPAHDNDSVSAFVKDQIIAFKAERPNDEFLVLAPHFQDTKSFTEHESYCEYRFHYFWPYRFEKLAGRSIIPSLRENKLRYLLIPFFFIGELFAMWQLARHEHPDYLYAHWFTPQGINAAVISKIMGIPYVYTTHAADVEVWRKIPLGGFVVRLFSKKARAITAVSQRSMAKLQEFFNDKQWQQLNTRIIPMGVDLAQFDTPRKKPEELKKEYGFENKKILFFVGRLAEKKGITYLLQAFAELHEEHPEVRLIIAGDGQLRPHLEKEAQQLRISNKTLFTGYVSGQKKSDYFHLSDILVLPSIVTKDGDAEGLPVVLMEGLAAGKLCVATYVSGADDILTDQKDGFLIDDRDVDSLVATISDILTMNNNEKQIVSQNARQLSKTMDWHQVAERHYEFLFQ